MFAATIFLTALIPMIVGSIWYNPNVFGRVYLRGTGLRPDDQKHSKMWLTLLLTYLLSCMVASFLPLLVIHQVHLFSIVAHHREIKDANSAVHKDVYDFLNKYGNEYRTFKHGAFHGMMAALFFAMPVIGFISLFERKRFIYFAVHVGYWILTLALMGGVICQFAKPY